MPNKPPAAKKSKKQVKHPCFEQINKLLAARNGRLVAVISLSGAPRRFIVQTEKLDSSSRMKPGILVANFCPFCGAPS